MILRRVWVPIAIGDRNGGGYMLRSGLTIRGGCDIGMHYDIYCIGFKSIVDRISQLKESGFI